MEFGGIWAGGVDKNHNFEWLSLGNFLAHQEPPAVTQETSGEEPGEQNPAAPTEPEGLIPVRSLWGVEWNGIKWDEIKWN